MLDFQQMMARDRGRVIRFKNVDSEDFSHTFDGYGWTIKAGESQFFPVAHARLFAKHLARKIIMRRKKATAEGRMDGTILFKDADMSDLMIKILSESVDLPVDTKTPEDAYRESVKEVNESLNTSNKPITGDMSKAEVIAKLQEKGKKVDARLSKEKLLEQLNES